MNFFWVVVSNSFYYHPENWGNDPIWRAYFFRMGWKHQLVLAVSCFSSFHFFKREIRGPVISDATQGNATKFKDDIDLGVMCRSIWGFWGGFWWWCGRTTCAFTGWTRGQKTAFCEVLFLVLHIFSGEKPPKKNYHVTWGLKRSAAQGMSGMSWWLFKRIKSDKHFDVLVVKISCLSGW